MLLLIRILLILFIDFILSLQTANEQSFVIGLNSNLSDLSAYLSLIYSICLSQFYSGLTQICCKCRLGIIRWLARAY